MRWHACVFPVLILPVTSQKRLKSTLVKRAAWLSRSLYFFAICPLLWIYGVTITNTFMTFWENQLQMPALNRGFVALFLLLLMAFVIWFGKDLMVKVMSYRYGRSLPARCLSLCH